MSRNRNNNSNIVIQGGNNNTYNPINFLDDTIDRSRFNNLLNNNVTQNNNVQFNHDNDNQGFYLRENHYKNDTLIDNNLNEELRLEYIDEKDIIIDTINRNVDIYPNIFDFKVKFGADNATPGPNIYRSLKNIKYIKLVKALLPDNYCLNKIDITANSNYSNVRSLINSGAGVTLTNTDDYNKKISGSGETIYVVFYPITSIINNVNVNPIDYPGSVNPINVDVNETVVSSLTSEFTFNESSSSDIILISNANNRFKPSNGFIKGNIVEIIGTTNFNFNASINSVSLDGSSISVNFMNLTTNRKNLDPENGTIKVYRKLVENQIDYLRVVNGSIDYKTVYSYDIANSKYFMYSKNEDSQIESGRFFQLQIDELESNHDLSTGSNVNKCFSLLYPSREDNRGFNNLDTLDTDKIYKFSDLKNVSSLTIKIKDCVGDLLDNKFTLNNFNLDNRNNPKNIINNNDTSNDIYNNSFRSASKYIRHPLSWNMQAQLIFNIGEVKIEQNKKNFI